MKLKTYLEKEHSPATVRIYLFEIRRFIDALGQAEAEKAGYAQVVAYFARLRQRYDNPETIRRISYAIRQYFYFLIETGKRHSHPCMGLRLRDRKKTAVQVQDLLSEAELELLLERKERYSILALRNQVVMSLLVYQALRPGEMARLRVEDIDLGKAQIHIRPTPKTNARSLSLKARQVMLFYRYLQEVRPQLQRNPTETLILTKVGTSEKGEGIHYLVETYRHLFPSKKLTPTTIRQSVIAGLLKKGHDLRIVQVFAGHKKPSATEKYRQNNLQALKLAVNKYHPLIVRSISEGDPLADEASAKSVRCNE